MVETLKKKTCYYIYSEAHSGYWTGYSFDDVACPSSYYKRFKSIKSAENEIKTTWLSTSTDNDLAIDTTEQVRARRKKNLILYYTTLIKKIRKTFTKKEFRMIMGEEIK